MIEVYQINIDIVAEIFPITINLLLTSYYYTQNGSQLKPESRAQRNPYKSRYYVETKEHGQEGS